MDKDKNHVSNAIADVLGRLALAGRTRRDNLLSDLAQDYPELRKFLVGTGDNGDAVPAGTLTIEAGDGACSMSLRWFAFSLEANYAGDSWHGMLELIETDLQEKTTPWKRDWRKRKAAAEALRKAID